MPRLPSVDLVEDAMWTIQSMYWWNAIWSMLMGLWMIVTPSDRFKGSPWQYLMVTDSADNWYGIIYCVIAVLLYSALISKRERLLGFAILSNGVYTAVISGFLFAGGLAGSHSGLGAPALLGMAVAGILLSIPLTKKRPHAKA